MRSRQPPTHPLTLLHPTPTPWRRDLHTGRMGRGRSYGRGMRTKGAELAVMPTNERRPVMDDPKKGPRRRPNQSTATKNTRPNGTGGFLSFFFVFFLFEIKRQQESDDRVVFECVPPDLV